MELTVLEWNKSAEEMFGYSRGEIVGKTLYDTVLDGLVDADDVITTIKTQLEKSMGGFQNINKNKRNDGTIITCDWYNSPVFDDEGQPLYLISEAINISQDIRRNEVKEQLAPYIKEKSAELDDNLQRFEELLRSVNNNLLGTTSSISENRKETETFAQQFHEIDEILASLDDILGISHINQINLRIQASRLHDQKSGEAFKVIGSQFDQANNKVESLIQKLNTFYQKIQLHLNGMNDKFSYLQGETERQQERIDEVRNQYVSIQEYLQDFHVKVNEYLQL